MAVKQTSMQGCLSDPRGWVLRGVSSLSSTWEQGKPLKETSGTSPRGLELSTSGEFWNQESEP